MEGREETWSQLTFQSTRKRSDFGWKTAKKASTGRKENMTGRIIPYTSVFIGNYNNFLSAHTAVSFVCLQHQQGYLF